MPPGYDSPTKEFFDLLFSLDNLGKDIYRLTLYGNNFEELETIQLERAKKHLFIFGLWPWQFTEYRKAKITGEFTPFHFAPLKKDLYLAPIEVELTQTNINQSVTLKGCAIKTSLNEKIKQLILSNHELNIEKIAELYLNHWPNFGEAFQDFSHKIELFTYTAQSQRHFSTKGLNLGKGPSPDIKILFDTYLKALDLYVKWHFLPTGYEETDFSALRERFYALKAISKEENDHILITFQPPEGYLFLKELDYACRRLNEREIISLAKNKRLWFTI
jgi:hypothetical protein